MTEEITIAVTSVVLVVAVPLLRALGDRLEETRVLSFIGLGLTIVGGIVVVWTMLGILARELR